MRQISWSNPNRPSRPSRSVRYAPEFLERKLSPSSMGGAPVAAQVQVIGTTTSVDDPPTFPPYEPGPPGNPGPTPPTLPGGPSDPD